MWCNVDGSRRQNSLLNALSKDIRIIWILRDFLSNKEWTTPRPFHWLQRWTPFYVFLHLFLRLDGSYIIWMSKVVFYIVVSLKKCIWRNPLILRIVAVFCDNWRNPCMVLSKPIMHGMRNWPLFINLDLKCHESYHDICVLDVKDVTLIVALYVDDLVIIGSNANLILGW